jgi:NAD(P)-dependent dehydrogenase (short-subunit alcohol dehydrogenase family)
MNRAAHETDAPPHLLVFGASGAIGQAIASAAIKRSWLVTGAARTAPAMVGVRGIAIDPAKAGFDAEALRTDAPYTAICWAQGANCNDTVYDVDMERHMDIYAANVAYILVTMKAMLGGGMLAPATRMCVISSIWQNLTRQSKLSYCVSKAALQGLVMSASADLAKDGHLINAVLPGAMETPMTRRNLSAKQIERLTTATGFGRLAELGDVASLVLYLCSPENTGITGQFIAADLGFSHVRIV